MSEKITHRRNTPIKKRSRTAYDNKAAAIKDWYSKLIIYREKNPEVINPNNKLVTKRKELKPLDYYLALLKKVDKWNIYWIYC